MMTLAFLSKGNIMSDLKIHKIQDFRLQSRSLVRQYTTSLILNLYVEAQCCNLIRNGSLTIRY